MGRLVRSIGAKAAVDVAYIMSTRVLMRYPELLEVVRVDVVHLLSCPCDERPTALLTLGFSPHYRASP